MRQTLKSDGVSCENDAEHAWHMAIMTMLLAEYASEPIDVLRTMSMLLIHDLVEIDAGDTYAYDETGKATQQEREQAAAERVFAMLPDDQGRKMRALWDEFEAGETAEARFAMAMDRIQPMMLNAATDGQKWKENGVTLSKIMARNKATPETAPALWDYTKEYFIDPHVESGSIRNE
jgi:putative hydrolase of HD superfamily